jgi:hypothetical protein
MAMTHDQEQQLIQDVAAIKQCLLGYNGQHGLCHEFEEVKEDHYKLRRTVIVLIAFIAGSGCITGGVAAMVNLLA